MIIICSEFEVNEKRLESVTGQGHIRIQIAHLGKASRGSVISASYGARTSGRREEIGKNDQKLGERRRPKNAREIVRKFWCQERL